MKSWTRFVVVGVLLPCAACVVIQQYQTGLTVRWHWETSRQAHRMAKSLDAYSSLVEQKIEAYKKTSQTNVFAEVERESDEEARAHSEFEKKYPAPSASKPLPRVARYSARIGMPKEVLQVLYGSPTRVLEKPDRFGAQEAWVYDYSNGERYTFFIKDGVIVAILVKYIEGI